MSDGLLIQIDGHDYKIPDDLDLNDVAALEDEGFSLETMDSMGAVRFVVWRLLRRHQPEITLEDAGSKVQLGMLAETAAEEPPPIPLHGPDPRSGMSSEPVNGSGSAAAPARVQIHEAAGTP
jgi:hypothetical protein